ncbi:MAG: alpha-amylase family glycosyl hydrolase, partial [Akkermansiaceae bacterium]
MINTTLRSRRSLTLVALLFSWTLIAQAEETILQYFGTSWKGIEKRIPEVAEAGYTSLWLPPPFKGASGTFSVGFDPFDRFDLGNIDQSGTIPTKYGTKEDLLSLIRIAHRFGIKVYFDNVMAHNGGPLGNTEPGNIFPDIPGFVPEDFHLVRTSSGGWRKASNDVNYQDEWQVLHRNPFAWDIAHETPNTSFDPDGEIENSDYVKWIGVRHPGHPEWYLDRDLPIAKDYDRNDLYTFANKEAFKDTGYGVKNTGANNGRFDFDDLNRDGQHNINEPSEPFSDTGIDGSNPTRRTAAWGFGDGIYNMGDPVPEDVNSMLLRAL